MLIALQLQYFSLSLRIMNTIQAGIVNSTLLCLCHTIICILIHTTYNEIPQAASPHLLQILIFTSTCFHSLIHLFYTYTKFSVTIR